MNGGSNPSVGIIGLGYVGLPLAIEFSLGGCEVLGVDIDPDKPRMIEAKKSYLRHIPSEKIARAVDTGRFRVTTDFAGLSDVNAILICVPTPLGKARQPDLGFVTSTAAEVARHLRKGQLVVLESTTYPGTTRDEMVPILEKSGLKAGKDFHVAFSPEREDPGNKSFSTRTIPKLVGGLTKECTRRAAELYSHAVDEVVEVSSPEVSEMAKILENTFRAVNIALVNELKVLAAKMGIDIWEVIEAASTKPFGYTPFYPGPGLGGHCIPIDPFYLTWKARQYEMPTRFIELAGEVNTSMPSYVVKVIGAALNDHEKSIKGSRIMILGMAYKPDIDDYRETPALKVMEKLERLGAQVDYNDPYVSEVPDSTRQSDVSRRSVDLGEGVLSTYDLVVVITNHACYDYDSILCESSILVDTRNAFVGVAGAEGKVIKA